MKSTTIMLATVATFVLVWLMFATGLYLLDGDISFRDAMKDPFTMIFMIVVGWIPCIIVGQDLDERLINR